MNTYNFEELNNLNSFYIPSNVKYLNTQSFMYWLRSLYQRAVSVLEIDTAGLWEAEIKDYLYFCLFRFGFVPVFKTDELGVVFSKSSLTGFDFWYQPTTAVIANPALKKGLELKIGEECEILKLTPDYRGIFDILGYYAEKLSTLDGAINMAIINSKFAYFVAGKNKAAANALKQLFDKINKGEPIVFFDKKLENDPTTKEEPWQFLQRENLKNSYITTDLLKDFQTILNNFDAEIGIPSIPYEKKERMVTTEADSRMIDAKSRSIVWKDCLSESMEKINDMFGVNLSVKLRYEQEEEQEEGVIADE